MPHRLKTMDFKAALDEDMKDKGINERLLGKELNVTQQSINKWRARGFPPLYRVQQLIAYFGPNSRIAKLDFQGLVTDVPRVRVQPPANVLPGMPETAALRAEEALAANENNAGGPPHAELVTFLRTAPARDRFLTNQTVEFLRVLPGDLHDNMLPANTKVAIGDAWVHPDYLSDKVALIQKTHFPGDMSVGKSQHILELAGIKKLHPRLKCVLAVCYPGDDTGKAVGHTRRALAEALGVEVWVCRTGGAIARKLAMAEGLEVEESGADDSSDEDLDIDEA